ncbi:MAG: hypothetical protein ABJF01_11285 [bacterium]
MGNPSPLKSSPERPRTIARFRLRRVVASALVAVTAGVGASALEPQHATKILAVVAGVLLVAAAVLQSVGEGWRKQQRWLTLALWLVTAGAVGIIVRSIVHSFRG